MTTVRSLSTIDAASLDASSGKPIFVDETIRVNESETCKGMSSDDNSQQIKQR